MENKDVIKDPNIFISKETRELYENLQQSLPEFKRMENKDFFMLLAVFGRMNNKYKPLQTKEAEKSGFTRERYLGDYENSILKAIAVAEKKDITMLSKIPEVYAIAEGVANGGSKHLKDFVFENPASFIKKFAEEVKRLIK